MKNKLETMDAVTLMTTPMDPLRFIVGGLIPQGLHILAGAPKIGKSWLALWICLQCGKGERCGALKPENARYSISAWRTLLPESKAGCLKLPMRPRPIYTLQL